MGVATGRSLERVAAAMGQLDGAPVQFEAADDIPNGGVLCAVPALLAIGLLRHTHKTFSLPQGFYPIETIFLALAFLALARVRSLEQLRYEAPGEWGKLLGLDRIAEVKTIRAKLTALCNEAGRAQRWSGELAKEWMGATDPNTAGMLYVDSHVRVYNGELTKLPRRYVSRELLFLRGTTDYWVNAMDGQPFFVVTQPVDPGMVKVLTGQIVPRLKIDVPNQPTDFETEPRRCRFTLIFDRAGYSPDFFAQMQKEHVAVITYHKFPDDDWAAAEFAPTSVTLIHGETVTLDLAERGTRLSNGMWLREIRHRDTRGHQTSILSTNYALPTDRIACAMFARWCQENFFKYMLENYGLDRLVEYGVEPLPDATQVVNPAWRTLDSKVRREAALLSRATAEFGALHLPAEAAAESMAVYEARKGKALLAIELQQAALVSLKAERKKTAKHVAIKDLPEADRFSQLRSDKKHLVDTLKMIAYRAETALVHIATESMARARYDVRAWVRGLLASTVDLRPDHKGKTLTVQIHRQATRAHDAVLDHVCDELTATETIYPGTDLRLVFAPVGSSSFSLSQEV